MLRHLVCGCRDFPPGLGHSLRNPRDSAGSWPLSFGASEPETAGSAPKECRDPRLSLSPSWAVRIRFRFASVRGGTREICTASSNFLIAKSRGSDSLLIRQRVLRVRISLAPPFSLRVRRLPARSWAQSEKSPRFRGVLAVKPARIRTGDCGFRASMTPLPAFFSVAKLGGSDSLEIRLAESRRGTPLTHE